MHIGYRAPTKRSAIHFHQAARPPAPTFLLLLSHGYVSKHYNSPPHKRKTFKLKNKIKVSPNKLWGLFVWHLGNGAGTWGWELRNAHESVPLPLPHRKVQFHRTLPFFRKCALQAGAISEGDNNYSSTSFGSTQRRHFHLVAIHLPSG